MNENQPHVVIVGGGFGGLYAAKELGKAGVQVTLVDKRNFHLFQPLLYQVATGGVSPGDIASPLRSVLKRFPTVAVQCAEVVDIRAQERRVILDRGDLTYDYLVVAAGASHHYFGNDEWAAHAPGLKTVEEALGIRRRILEAFEAAERAVSEDERDACLRFVIIGAGPTGVELAGALAELAHRTLANEFRRFDPRDAEVILLEGADRVLPPYPADLSAKAARALARLGVDVRTSARVTQINADSVRYLQDEEEVVLQSRTIVWAAGMRGATLGEALTRETDAALDRSGRVVVDQDLSLKGCPNVFVAGDLAAFIPPGEERPLPGVAPVAMQQGRYAARAILKRMRSESPEPFRYRDKGSLAVIGRNAAVANLGFVRFNGTPDWLAWIFIHIAYLIEYDNKLKVLFQWAWSYATRKRGARLITDVGGRQ